MSYAFLLYCLFVSSSLFAQDLDYVAGSSEETIVVQQQSAVSDQSKAEAGEDNESSEATNPLANLRITGQIRHRSEMHERFDVGSEPVPRFHLLRTRLNVSFQPLEDILAHVQIQDSRLFGGQDPSLARGTFDGSADALDFHQAYFKVSDLFDTNISVKVGRQELAFGNERLIGAVGWHNIGRTFDAAVLNFADKHRSISVFTSQLVGSVGGPASQNLHGMYSTFHYLWTHNLDLFFLLDNNKATVPAGVDSGKSRLNRYTYGGSVYGKENVFMYRLELAGQAGDIAMSDSTARATISSYMFNAETGLGFSGPSKLQTRISYTMLSGDSTPGDQSVRTFNTLFATNHKFYGFLDYFPASYNGYGLQNVAFHLSGKAGERLLLRADVHYFMLPEAAPLGNGTDTALGKEVDLTVAYKYNKNFSIGTGASYFMAEPLMEAIIGDSSSWWFYLSTQVTF